MADTSTADWHPVAAYLYVLQLDGPSLAWEYLRRNPDYRRDWQRRRRRPQQAQHWGLRLLENPDRDARDAHPDWLPDPRTTVLVYPDTDPPAEPQPFRFWRLPGHKHLLHDGRRLMLTSRWVGHVLRLAISPELEDGMGYVYAIRADHQLRQRWRVVEAGLALLEASDSSRNVLASDRPDRAALLHLRTLQALDGVQAGASQHRVAEVLFGATAVAERWHSDGDLRARVRRLIGRGQRLMWGDYRRLLHPDAAVEERSAARTKRP